MSSEGAPEIPRDSKKRLERCFYAGLIAALICLPLYYSKGALFIGGDTVLPFQRGGIQKYLWQWLDLQNGAYFAINYFPNALFYGIADFFTANIYLKSASLLLAINALSAWGIYRVAKLLGDGETPFLYFAATAFYLLAPIHYNAGNYLQIYALIPWFLYFTIKIIKSGRIGYVDIIGLNAVLFAGSMDLPNPKYVFHLFFILCICVAGAVSSRNLDLRFFVVNRAKIIWFFLISAYLYVPQVYFALHYNPLTYGTAVKAGYTNDSQARMMDYGSATVDKMFRLFHNGLTFNMAARPAYLSSVLVTFSNFFFIGLIVFYFIRNRRPAFYDRLFAALALVYLFFAAGPNPPLGFFYEWLVTHFSLLAFLRTTAGAVFYLALFFALLSFSALKYFDNRRLNIAFTACLLISAYPLLNGEYYRNWSPANNFVSDKEYGMRIPDNYFQFKSAIDTKKLDARILVPNSNLSYINTSWGYFGPAAHYYYMYDGYFIGINSILTDFPKHAVGYVLRDNSLYDASFGLYRRLERPSVLEATSDFLQLYSVGKGDFLPVIYAPSTVIQGDPGDEETPADSAILGLTPPLHLAGGSSKPSIEYKKSSPASYRVRVHGIKSDFILVLSETFNAGWRIFADGKHAAWEDGRTMPPLQTYKILENNENEQASAAELSDFIGKGWITTLGSGMERAITHRQYSSTQSKVASIEKYSIDFVSKDNFGTIQNNNLPGVGTFETSFARPLTAQHRLANRYANSWVIRRADLEREAGSGLIKNKDGSVDAELILEFRPQKIFDLSALVSLASLALVCFLAAWERLRRRPINGAAC